MKPNFKSLEFIYQDTAIHFLLGNQGNVMINATDMAKAFNKNIKDFNKLESTKRFIEQCLISDEKSLIGISDKNHLLKSVKNKGTFMHQILALKLATWLDTCFEVWVFCKIQNLLLGNYQIHKQKTIDIESIKKELQHFETEIRSGNYKNAIAYLDKQKQLKQLQNDKKNALLNQTKLIQLELF